MVRGKGKKKRTTYLSTRFYIWLIFFCLFFLVVFIICMLRPELLLGNQTAGVVIALIMAAFLLILYFWIARPYYEKEYRLRRILDGYITMEDPEAGLGLGLTPVLADAEKAVYKIINSSQTVNMNKRQAQYLALQNQINPHFLYNTLDGIRSEALIAGLDNVAEMTEAMAVFFRYTISNVENLMTIDDEIDNCKSYFKIQQYRFGERISLDIQMEQPDLGSYLIPKLTLQPILENSIIHGTEMKIGKGTTVISICKTDSRILIEVKDDGVGMDENTLERLNRKLDIGGSELADMKSSKGGIALSNVNNRIHLLFGREYGIQIFSVKDVGTSVEISLPAVTRESLMRDDGNDT